VAALVLGETTEVTPAQWEVLTRTGVNHLVSISGLHVGLAAASLFFLTRWFWSRSPWLVSRLAAPRAGALGGLVAALIYSALAGFAVCTQRSLIMLGVVLVALLWSRTPRPWTGLTYALAAVLLLDPTEALSFGLWLSFGGVAALIYGLGNRLALEGLWRRWGQAQWVATLGFLPLLLLLFSRASVVSPLVNLVAIPLFGLLLPLVLIAAGLLLTIGIETPLVWTAALLAWLLDGLTAISAWPWASVGISARPDWAWVAAFGGALLLLAPRGIPGRWLGLPLLLPLGLLTPPAPATGEAWLRLLDVGQGLSAVIRTAHHVLVFDTGPAFLGGFNTGEAVVVPYLRDQGLSRIDTLVLSHGDQDHVGGFAGLAAQMPIDRILAGRAGRAGRFPGGALSRRPGLDLGRGGLRGALSGPGRAGGQRELLRAARGHPGRQPAGAQATWVRPRKGNWRGAAVWPRPCWWLGITAAIPPAAVNSWRPWRRRGCSMPAASPIAMAFPPLRVRERVAAAGVRELNTAEAGAIGFVLTATGLAGSRAVSRGPTASLVLATPGREVAGFRRPAWGIMPPSARRLREVIDPCWS
jgi:ComEC/Rec2-related protein